MTYYADFTWQAIGQSEFPSGVINLLMGNPFQLAHEAVGSIDSFVYVGPAAQSRHILHKCTSLNIPCYLGDEGCAVPQGTLQTTVYRWTSVGEIFAN